MSVKRFEEFITTQFFEWAVQNIRAGFRYQFKSPNPGNGRRLHAELLSNSVTSAVVKGTSIPYVICGNIKLLPVLHCDNDVEINAYTENFISLLRDEIAAQQGELAGSALLIIHNSLLDTLINSAEDLATVGAVWHPTYIQTALKKLIDKRDSGRDVSLGLLNYQFDAIIDDDSTMFGFEALYHAVADGDIHFDELDLFKDPMIFEMENKPEQIRRRLDENKKLFNQIHNVVENYPEDLANNLPDLSDKFVIRHFQDDDEDAWKSVSFDDYRAEQDKNRTQELILEVESSLQCDLIARSKSDTKAGQRNRQIILIVAKDVTEFDVELSFRGGKIEQSELIVKANKELLPLLESKVSPGSKRSKVSITGPVSASPIYFRININREKTSEKYQFHILVLCEGQFNVEAFRNNFLVDDRGQCLVLQTEDNSLKINKALTTQCLLEEIGQKVEFSTVGVLDFEKIANESDEIRFSVENNRAELKFYIEGAVATESLYLPLILDKERFVYLFNDDYFGVFNREKNKVFIDNKEVAPKGRRLTLLQREYELLFGDIIYNNNERSILISDLHSSFPDLGDAYKNLFEILKKNRTLVSLVSWGEEFTQIVTQVVVTYENALTSIPCDEMLDDEHKNLLKLGMCEQDRERWITPFHPIVLSYYLYLSQKIQQDDDNNFSILPDVTISRLNPQGLIPFLYHPHYDFTYSSAERDNCLWIRLVPQQDTSYAFVPKLVKDKITEFRSSFASLFEGNSQSPLIINSINNGENKELFIGLVDYIRSKKNRDTNIHVNLYDKKIRHCEFDYFSETSSYDEIKSHYNLDKGKARENADAVIDLLRKNLTYSKFSTGMKVQAYAHLSFFRNKEKVEIMQVNVDEEESGVICHGLISGEASYSKKQSYVTGFGLKNVVYSNNKHLIISKLFSTLLHPAEKANTPYRESSAISIAVSDNFKGLLERSYDSSIWTTIIDPKVTLDFFKESKDVVLIHYSDQYTNSAGYDAITVSRQTDLYHKVLEKDEGGIIGEFNAFNGEWLLKMITADPRLRKERKGILGAYKFVSCMLKDSGIIWVPLSIGEMIRVSGNIGLKMADSDFSRHVHGYKSGAISDDVLFVGFKNKHLYLLPLEVKTGSRPDYKKAIAQSKELKRYIAEVILGGASLANHLYRGLFIRQILMQIDKYRLYNVYSDDYFKPLLDSKEWWLQGDYCIEDIPNYPEGLVLAHVENSSCFEPSFIEEDNILKIELPLGLLAKLVATPLRSLMTESQPEAIRFTPPEYLLKSTSNADQATASNNMGITEKLAVAEKQQNYIKNVDGDTGKLDNTAQNSHDTSLKILVGEKILNREKMYWEPTNTAKFMNPNVGIIGTMGTGKTQCTKSIITQLYQNQHNNVEGRPIGMLIFDYKSDYVDNAFCKATNAKTYKLHKLPYNPLSLYGDTPVLPVHTARGFSETMAKAFGLGQKQQLRLRKLINEAYELAGISKNDPATWTKPAPTIADVWQLFISQEKVEEDSLYAALESLYDMEIFEENTEKVTSLYELIEGVVVIELASYPREIQNLIVALTLDLFYSQMQKKGKPQIQGDFRQLTKLVLVDEADNFMSQNFPSLRKVLKEGREYGVGIILSTQDITHFKTGENDYSAYILSWVVHRVSQIKNQDIKALFNIDDKNEQERLMSTIRELEKHHSLYVDGDKNVIKIKDKAFWEL